jgi:hypothetical protein
LEADELPNPESASAEERVHLRAVEGLGFGRSLNLDEQSG